MKHKRHWAIFVLMMFVVSCGISGDLKKLAKSRKQALETALTEIESTRKKYTVWKTSSEYTRFARYDQYYGWSDQYEASLAEVESARSIWGEIEQILKANKPESEGQLKIKIEQLNSRLRLALKKSKEPDRQIDFLRQLMDDAPNYIQTADRQFSEMKKIPLKVRPVVDKAVDDSKRFGWGKEQDIANRFSQMEALYTTAATAFSTAKAQNSSKDPDYAVMAENLQVVEQKLPELKQADSHLRKRLEELNRSYTKQLIDMKYAYMVAIGRTSWANYYDFPKETDYVYRSREVDKATYDYLSASTSDIASGLRYVRTKLPRAMWDTLGIDPAEMTPRGDDSAVFWVNSTEIDYYHRYRIIENDQKKETDWEKVDEDLFADNIDNLGMDIISKPYGLYESEVIKQATPPGMAYVGNEKYGSWRKDSAGNSFWAFYGRYAFLNALLGGNRYYYNDWNHWNRNYRGRAPYYGKNPDGSARYGTSGSTVLSSSNYRSTTFAKRGGVKAAPADIRSAAGGVRGRGPGRSGK